MEHQMKAYDMANQGKHDFCWNVSIQTWKSAPIRKIDLFWTIIKHWDDLKIIKSLGETGQGPAS